MMEKAGNITSLSRYKVYVNVYCVKAMRIK